MNRKLLASFGISLFVWFIGVTTLSWFVTVQTVPVAHGKAFDKNSIISVGPFPLSPSNVSIMQLDDLPYLPMPKDNCYVDFVNPNHQFCNTLLNADIAVLVRLLEHRFQCNASKVATKVFGRDNCFDMPTNFRYLIPFIYPNFYYLPTSRQNASFIVCAADSDTSDVLLPHNMTLHRITPSFQENWFTFYDSLRYCDYIASSNEDLILAARSIGVPLLTHGMGPWPPRPIWFRYRAERLNFTTANALANRFPFHLFQTIVDKDAVNDPDALEPHQNKTLVIVLGNLRGGESTWNTLYRHVLDLNNADLALMIGQQPYKNTSSMYQRAKYLWEFGEYDDWGDAIDEMMNSSEWRTLVLPHVSRSSGLFGGVKGYISSTAISFMARYWLIKILQNEGLVERYERFIVTRSDHFYKCDHDVSLLDPRYIWVPTLEDYGGITDRHMVCHRSHLLDAMDLYPHFLSHPDKYVRQNRIMKQNAESLIRMRWIEKNLYPHYIRRFPRVMYTAATATDKSRWSYTYPWQKTNADGLKTKYKLEYEFAHCYCAGGKVTVFKNKKRKVELDDAEREYECTNTSTDSTSSAMHKVHPSS